MWMVTDLSIDCVDLYTPLSVRKIYFSYISLSVNLRELKIRKVIVKPTDEGMGHPSISCKWLLICPSIAWHLYTPLSVRTIYFPYISLSVNLRELNNAKSDCKTRIDGRMGYHIMPYKWLSMCPSIAWDSHAMISADIYFSYFHFS